jgi:hypothetical protein
MSHSIGAIKFQDETIKWYEYNGTCDIPISHTYNTKDEDGYLHWDNSEDWAKNLIKV